jgi:prevent-host-death family protein
MGLESRIKPISYLKANAAEVLRELNEGAEPLVITQNGEAKASYYQMQETMALLKLLALAKENIAAGKVKTVEGLADRIRARAAEETRFVE